METECRLKDVGERCFGCLWHSMDARTDTLLAGIYGSGSILSIHCLLTCSSSSSIALLSDRRADVSSTKAKTSLSVACLIAFLCQLTSKSAKPERMFGVGWLSCFCGSRRVFWSSEKFDLDWPQDHAAFGGTDKSKEPTKRSCRHPPSMFCCWLSLL